MFDKICMLSRTMDPTWLQRPTMRSRLTGGQTRMRFAKVTLTIIADPVDFRFRSRK